MTTKTASRMVPLQMPMTMFQRLEELGASEQQSVSQVVRGILHEALNLKDGKVSLPEILAVFSRGDSHHAASHPVRPLRISFLKR
jgi:hypothetical protein